MKKKFTRDFSWDNYIDIKFDRGDNVRISVEKTLFEKSFTANWSKEIYIYKKSISNPPRYNIKSLDEKEYDFYFYIEELQKVFKEEFPFDSFKVLEETDEKVLVEKLNSKVKNLNWIDKSDLLKK